MKCTLFRHLFGSWRSDVWGSMGKVKLENKITRLLHDSFTQGILFSITLRINSEGEMRGLGRSLSSENTQTFITEVKISFDMSKVLSNHISSTDTTTADNSIAHL